jgi:hypothetical protein
LARLMQTGLRFVSYRTAHDHFAGHYTGNLTATSVTCITVRKPSGPRKFASSFIMRDNAHAMRKVKMIARCTPEGWWARGVGESVYTQLDCTAFSRRAQDRKTHRGPRTRETPGLNLLFVSEPKGLI